MKFNNSQVRRQDRLLDETSALRLLKEGEYGILSIADTIKGGAYGIPVNYVWDGKQSIYLHSAPVGRKLDLLKTENKVSFCVVGKTNVIPGKFTTEYESIVLECIVYIPFSNEERMEALLLIVDKYSPTFKETSHKYIKGSFARTEVIRLDVVNWSGKTKRLS